MRPEPLLLGRDYTVEVELRLDVVGRFPFVAIADPVRPDVPLALTTLENQSPSLAGTRLRMLESAAVVYIVVDDVPARSSRAMPPSPPYQRRPPEAGASARVATGSGFR